MSLAGESVLSRDAIPAIHRDDSSGPTPVGEPAPAVFGGGITVTDAANACLHAGDPANSDTGSWRQTATFDFLSLNTQPPLPSLARENTSNSEAQPKEEVDARLDGDLRLFEHLHVQAPNEVFVLDEVGVCEDEATLKRESPEDAADSSNIQKDAVKMDVLSSLVNEGEKAPQKLSPELDDDILSIMCDDRDVDDIFGDDTAEEKRGWSSESRGSSKRKQDSPTQSRSPPDIKRSRSASKTPPEGGRSRAFSVHSRLGKKRHQTEVSERDVQRVCFNFSNNGNCFRSFCPFLHLGPSALENGTVHNRRGRVRQNCDVGPDYANLQHVQELQQQVQELQMQMQQQKMDLESLMNSIQQIEIGLKHHAVQQADQVFEQLQAQLHHQQQQHQAGLQQTQQVYEQLNNTQDKVEECERLVGSLCVLLQLVLMQNAGNTSRSTHLENINIPHWLLNLMPNSRQLSPKGKPGGDCPTRPGSADYENQRRTTGDFRRSLHEEHPRRPQSADSLNHSCHLPSYYPQGASSTVTPLQQPQVSRRHDFHLGPAYSNAPLMGDLPVPMSQPYCRLAGNPSGIVRLLPVRHGAESAFEAYHKRAPVHPR